MDYNKRVKEIIEKIPYINISSLDENGMPWGSPVFAAYDKEYNFYFGTYKNSQKAKNIRSNENVFLTIYDSTVPAGQGEGVYIKAMSLELKDPEEIKEAHQLLWSRHVTPYWKLEQVAGDGSISLYKIIPKKIWVNGEGKKDGDYIDTRIEVYL